MSVMFKIIDTSLNVGNVVSEQDANGEVSLCGAATSGFNFYQSASSGLFRLLS